MSDEKKKDLVFHQDAEVVPEWPARIREAQAILHYRIGARDLRRIPYGKERLRWDTRRNCHDCAVMPGQLHVPGCDVEECPACGGQACFCGCRDDPEQDAGP